MIARFCPFVLPVQAFAHDERGATAIEYALIATLISVVIIGAVTSLGTSVAGLFGSAAAPFE